MRAGAISHRNPASSSSRDSSSRRETIRTIHHQNSSNSNSNTANNEKGLDDTLRTSNHSHFSKLFTASGNPQQQQQTPSPTTNNTSQSPPSSMDDWSHKTIEFDDSEKGKVRVTSLLDGFLRFRRHRSESGSMGSAGSHPPRQHPPSTSSRTNSPTPRSNGRRPSFTKSGSQNRSMSSLGSRRSIDPNEDMDDDCDQEEDPSRTGSVRYRRRRVSFQHHHDVSINSHVNTEEQQSHHQQRSDSSDVPPSSLMDASWHVQLDATNASIEGSYEKAVPPQFAGPSSHDDTTEQHQHHHHQMWFEKYMPDSVNWIRKTCGTIVLDERFQMLIIVLIIVNAIILGLDTFDFVDENPSVQRAFDAVNMGFLIIFTIELGLQFGYWGYQLFFDGWLVFDFLTVVLSWGLDGVQVFRCFRIFRSFRLIVRIPILRSLVHAVIHVLPRIGSIMALFSLILYIYSVMCTVLWKDLYQRGLTEDTDYFGRLDLTAFTLFQFVTLEGWGEVARLVVKQYYYAWFIFNSFLVITGFILYSLVIAVVCDSFLVAEQQFRKEMKEANRNKKRKRTKNASEKLQDELDALLPPQQRSQTQPSAAFRESLSESTASEGKAIIRSSVRRRNDKRPVQDRIRVVQEDLGTLGAKQQEILATLQELVEQVDPRPDDHTRRR